MGAAGDGWAVGTIDEMGEGPGFRKVRRALGVTAFGVNAVVMPEGIESGFHYHDEQDELYFVHRGRIEITFGDGTLAAAGGGRPGPRGGGDAPPAPQRRRGRSRLPLRRRARRLRGARRPRARGRPARPILRAERGMAHAGQVIEGYDGFRLELVRTGAETGGELLEMEASYSGNAGMPPAHLHPQQTERFEVLEGAMRAVIGDRSAATSAASASRCRPARPIGWPPTGPRGCAGRCAPRCAPPSSSSGCSPAAARTS